MKTNRDWRLGATVAAALVVSAIGAAAADVKVAIVQMDRLVKAHPDTAVNLAVLEKQAKEYEDEQDTMREEMTTMNREFEELRAEAENKALSDKAREEKLSLAKEKVQALADYERKVRDTRSKRQRELSNENLRMLRRVVGKVRETIAGYARKKGFTLVLDAAGVGVGGVELLVYSDEKFDITEDVLKLMEKQKE